MSMSKYSGIGSLGFLAATGLYKLLKHEVGKTNTLETIRRIEIAILTIASGQYVIALNMPVKRLQRWRYADWLITTPLLLRTFHLLAVEKGFTGPFAPALTANIAMISIGYLAEFPETVNRANDQNFKRVMYAMSTASMLIIFYYVKQWDDYLKAHGVDTGRLPWYFYIGWSVYAINFLNPNEELRQTIFNIMDSINKGVYAIELDRVIRDNF